MEVFFVIIIGMFFCTIFILSMKWFLFPIKKKVNTIRLEGFEIKQILENGFRERPGLLRWWLGDLVIFLSYVNNIF